VDCCRSAGDRGARTALERGALFSASSSAAAASANLPVRRASTLTTAYSISDAKTNTRQTIIHASTRPTVDVRRPTRRRIDHPSCSLFAAKLLVGGAPRKIDTSSRTTGEERIDAMRELPRGQTDRRTDGQTDRRSSRRRSP